MPKKATDDQLFKDFMQGQDPPAIAHFRKVDERRIYSILRCRLLALSGGLRTESYPLDPLPKEFNRFSPNLPKKAVISSPIFKPGEGIVSP